ncbi:MAG: DUF4271 domain-containing protein [Saprospiraceae bacterium]|nr:DUF4271 domain-containing protein [Saprospiraceae bacterium]
MEESLQYFNEQWSEELFIQHWRAFSYWKPIYIGVTMISLLTVVCFKVLENVAFHSLFKNVFWEAETFQQFRFRSEKSFLKPALDVHFYVQTTFLFVFLFFKTAEPRLLLFVGMAILLALILKQLSFYFIDWVTIGKANYQYFRFTNNQGFRALGFVFLVFNLLLMNSVPLPYVAMLVVVVVLFYLWLIIRYLTIGLRYKLLKNLYFFIYLCTLEIAPLLVLAKLVSF